MGVIIYDGIYLYFMKGVASVKYANRLLTFNISNLKLN